MKRRKPNYYDAFHCIGGACTDTCCAGWEIEIDETTAETYRQLKGEFGEFLRKHIVYTEEEIFFRMEENRRCPMLKEDGWCTLIQEIGEEQLCDICREHPRHYGWYGNYTEVGLGISCEEVARIIFSQQEPISFILEEVDQDDETGDSEVEGLFVLRQQCMEIIEDRRLSLHTRLILLLEYGEIMQEYLADELPVEQCIIFGKEFIQNNCLGESKQQYTVQADFGEEELKNAYYWIVEGLKGLEALDQQWPAYMQELQENLQTCGVSWINVFDQYEPTAIELENLSVYYLYRYFMEGMYDGDYLGKLQFLVFSILMHVFMEGHTISKEGQYSLWHRIMQSKAYSKEIEYCIENMEALAEDFIEKEYCSVDVLKAMLSCIPI